MLHFGLRKATGYSDPLASKEELLFVTGVRSFPTRPVFSSDDHNADKHKMERFLHEGRCDCARGCGCTQTHGVGKDTFPPRNANSSLQLSSGHLTLDFS